MFANKEILEQLDRDAMETFASVYICECGFAAEDVNTMNEHRKSHGVDVQVKTLEVFTNNASEISNPSQHGSTSSSNNQGFNMASQIRRDLLVYRPDYRFNSDLSSEVDTEEFETLVPVSQPADLTSLFLCPTSKVLLRVGNTSLGDSLCSSWMSEHEQKEVPSPEKTLKKLLVSAFMERLPPAQTSWKPNEEHGLTKAAAPEASVGPPPSLASSVQQLRRLLTKSA
ncbi:zinc finger protein 84-like, partial [Arapaima gigas]